MIGLLGEIPGMSPEQANQIFRELDLGGKPAAGLIFHADGPMAGGGTRAIEARESEEALDAFLRERLGPLVARLGIALPPTIWPITNVLK